MILITAVSEIRRAAVARDRGYPLNLKNVALATEINASEPGLGERKWKAEKQNQSDGSSWNIVMSRRNGKYCGKDSILFPLFLVPLWSLHQEYSKMLCAKNFLVERLTWLHFTGHSSSFFFLTAAQIEDWQLDSITWINGLKLTSF